MLFRSWANLADDNKEDDAPAFIQELVRPINAQAGDLLKVSDFVKFDTVDGTWQNGTSAYEKRGVAAFVPQWNSENCIQCNKCAYSCPHATIRPFVLDDEENSKANFNTLDCIAPKELKGMHFMIQVDVLDCLGCGNCADVCPGKKDKTTGEIKKALKMVPLNVDDPVMQQEAKNWEYIVKNVSSKQHLIDVKQIGRASCRERV